jgi:hypothetical protein
MVATTSVVTTTHAPSSSRPRGRAWRNALLAEWTKIRTVRSTWWTLLAAAVITVGLSAIVCAVVAAQYSGMSDQDRATIDPASISITGGILAQLAIAVFGVLVITSEYATGMIRTTFAAVPQRLSVLGAKIAVFTGVTLTVTLAACTTAFLVGQLILSTQDLGIGLGATNALRTVVGTALYLTGLGLLALGLGTLIRKTAGAITAVVGVVFVLPAITSFLPSSLDSIQKYLPSNAGEAMLSGNRVRSPEDVAILPPWTGLGVFFLYAAATLALAAVAMSRRDA